MRTREIKKREIKDALDIVKAILITIVIIMVFYAILRNTASKLPSREMTVIDCYPIENYYEVVVEDSKGDQWSYFTDNYTEPGIITVLFNENETEIVDVR